MGLASRVRLPSRVFSLALSFSQNARERAREPAFRGEPGKGRLANRRSRSRKRRLLPAGTRTLKRVDRTLNGAGR